MKMLLIAPVTLALAAGGLSATAAPPDVPGGHWASRSVNQVMGKKIMRPSPDGKFHGDKPVTRYELAVTLDRFVKYIEAGRKPLHPMAASASAALPKGAPADVKQALAHLTSQGFLPATSTLLTKPGDKPVTAKELAQAMAQVTIRLSDRSLPPTKDAEE